MANTYTQLYIQFVFAVEGWQSLIPKAHKEEVHRYMAGVVQKRKHKMLRVHCMPDHTHLFVGLHPAQSMSDLIKELKNATNSFINKQEWMQQKFSWQKGYGAFSYHHSDIDRIVKYIINQEKHHQKQSFRQEYLTFLNEYAIAYDDQYLFDFLDDVAQE